MTGIREETFLRIEKLKVVYHKVSTAVEGVSLQIKKDQIVALLGTNGAGKTTTLRAVSGFLGIDDAKVTEGLIEFRGERIENRLPHEITRKGIVLVPEREKVFENLTVEENLQVSAASEENRTKRDEMNALVLGYFPHLDQLRRRLGGYLSGGERQMLAIASALVCRPLLLLVDELSLGLGPLIVDDLMSRLKGIRDEQKLTVLLVEQNALAALSIADFGYVIENGRIVFAGESERLRSHQDIQEFYLGQGERETRKSYRDVKQYRRTRRWYG